MTDKELLSIRYFVEYMYSHQYLLGRRFIVRRDHQALVWLFKLREPKGRIARWIEILSQYDFSVEYRPGTQACPPFKVADCGLRDPKGGQYDLSSLSLNDDNYQTIDHVAKKKFIFNVCRSLVHQKGGFDV